jgi:hypothetical protein
MAASSFFEKLKLLKAFMADNFSDVNLRFSRRTCVILHSENISNIDPSLNPGANPTTLL